jgi:hypothetical protein
LAPSTDYTSPLKDASPEVTVIVPTLALPERRTALLAALSSIRSQADVRALPLVVVNGQGFDRELVRTLERDPGVRLIRQEEASLPAAYRLARRHVTTPWFTALDDDDLLLPVALQRRVRALQDGDGFDAVVTNGYRRGHGGDVPVIADMARVARDPLGTLLESNWLLPGAWLCRTDAGSATLFDEMPAHLECTFLAVQLATRRRLRFIDACTVVWHAGTPGSASKSRAYLLCQAEAIARILSLNLPHAVRRGFRQRLGAARHLASELHLEDGRIARAWRLHLQSLAAPGGWRYLSFTRHLIARSLSRAPRPA